MQELSGMVRYRFRHDDDDVDILLEGEAEWIKDLVAELGLQKVGWMMPMTSDSVSMGSSGIGSSATRSPRKPKDMGPTPDPGRIPVIRRPIGELDLPAKLLDIGLEQPIKPEADDLRDLLAEVEEPHPAQGPMVVDPMGEAWLRELMRIVVRSYGVTAITTETIALAASDYLSDREDLELELFLEALFRRGLLVKIHGGDSTGWGPSPAWLASSL